MEYVGHPFFDEVAAHQLDDKFCRALRSGSRIDDRESVVGLLPGSRTQEVHRNFPVMLRVVRILHELAERWKEVHVDAAAALRAAEINGMAYTLVDNLRLLGIHDPALQESALRFWHERFFTDAYLAHDVEVPGAVVFARRCHQAGATLVYLTGRDLPNMALGTFASLRDLGFPIGVVGTELVRTRSRYGTTEDLHIRLRGGREMTIGSVDQLEQIVAMIRHARAA